MICILGLCFPFCSVSIHFVYYQFICTAAGITKNHLVCDVCESWMAAADTSSADVKELIPEFLGLSEFLVNTSRLPIMTTTDGQDISAVNPGDWCQNNHDFVHKMRYFLQSDTVSRGLSSWIDLIVGDKSPGEATIEAKNLFHPLCYIQEDEQTQSEDRTVREAAVACVINFGQCCNQAFKTPHPPPIRGFMRDYIMAQPTLLIY
jgi:hypothetical protein